LRPFRADPQETLPESLTRALKAPPAPQTATVVSIETARARRREREARSPNPEPVTPEFMSKASARPRWAVGAGIALAACVALAVVIGRPAMVPASNYAAPELAQALDSRLSGEQGAAARKSCSALPMQRARSAVVLPEARPRALPATMPMAGASNAGSPA
jgi:hypothetical protein